MASEPSAELRQTGYERRDANPRKLFVFFVLMGVALLLMAGLTVWTFGHFQKTAGPAPFINQPFENARPLPGPPRLQAEPGIEIDRYVEAQQQMLNSYGWSDKQRGVVRIPIDQAMKLVVQRGLPARTSQPAAGSNQGGSTGAPLRSSGTSGARNPRSDKGGVRQ